MNDAVFRATVHGLRTVPSRKVLQIVVEAPIEELPHVASVCTHGAWLAIARLCDEQEDHEKPDRSRDWDDMSPAEQAGVLCKDPGFWRYLCERRGMIVGTEHEAARVIRNICRVSSRKEISVFSLALKEWNNLVNDYRTWQLAPRVVA